MTAIAKYLEAAENEIRYWPGADIARRIPAEESTNELLRAARNAADEVRELVRELNRLDMKFRSGNGVPVERATITADEWNRIRKLVR